MDAFPAGYVEHNLPLVLLSGLCPDPDQPLSAVDPASTGSPAAGACIFSDYPVLTGGPATSLLDALLAEDASSWPCNSRYFGHKSNGTFTLPPRKALRPFASAASTADAAARDDEEGQAAPVVLHSPLSPLTPGSGIFPDGLMTPEWITKHQCLVPAAFVNFFPLTADTTMSSLRDNQLKIEINSLKRDWAQSGYKTRFVVVFMFEDGLLQDDASYRLSSIRKATGLDPRNVFTFPSSPSPVDIQRFVAALLSALQGPAVEYYRDLSKHTRRKRNRSSIPPPTIPPTSGTSQTLSSQGWNLRYEFKLGVFAEFRQEMDAACRSYESAYQLLFGDEVIGTIPGWNPRFNDARMLADVLAMRILRCYLWMGQTTSAVQIWNAHRARIQDVVTRRGKGTSNYGWEAWEVNWSLVMAYLLGRAHLSAFTETDNNATLNATASADEMIYVLPEKSILSGERMSPWSYLHHRGYWLNRAAKHTARRRLLAERIPEEDRIPPEQSSETQRKAWTNVYDTYQAPAPHDEYPLTDKPGARYSKQILQLLGESTVELSKRGQSRAVERQKFDMAKEHIRLESWSDALKILRPLWHNLSWREEGWWCLMEECGWLLRECAMRCEDFETVYRVDWELMNKNFTKRPDWKYDMHKKQDSPPQASKPTIILRDEEVTSCISSSFFFVSSQGNVGESLQGQLTLQSNSNEGSAPIHLHEVKITFDSGLPPIRLLADAANPAPALDASQVLSFISLSDAVLAPTGDSHVAAVNSMELKGRADLSVLPGQKKAFTLTLTPREAGHVRVASITVMIRDESYDLSYITIDRSRQRPSWWIGGRNGVVTRRIGKGRDPSSCHILPKPPKVLISVPGLRDAYYSSERAGLNIRLDNNEDAAATIVLEVKLKGQSELPCSINWLDDTERSEEPSEPETGTQSIRRKVAELAPAEHIVLPAIVIEAPHPTHYEMEISASYYLDSDPDTPISKMISLDLPFVQPFEATYDFLPRLHPAVWPDFFHMDDPEGDSQPNSLQQRWLVSSELMSFAREPLVIENVSLRAVSAAAGKVGAIAAVQTEQGSIRPEEPRKAAFIVDVERSAIDDRQSTALDFSLDIRWRRSDEQTETPESIPSTLLLPAQAATASLDIPRFVTSMSEPRVLASLSAATEHMPGQVQIQYTLENPSMHFLTFTLTMETSDQFAFSGPKSLAVQLVPLSRHTVQYSLLAARRGTWIRPQLAVVDSYYNKTLLVLPTEGIKTDGKGLLVWVD